MGCKVKEFSSYSEMLSYYQNNPFAKLIDLKTECDNRYYGVDIAGKNVSYYFSSDNTCSLQLLEHNDEIFLLVDEYFVVVNSDVRIMKLNSPGDSILMTDSRIVGIYETGIFLYDLHSGHYKSLEAKSCIYDWKRKSNAIIELKYDDDSVQEFNVQTELID